MDDETSSILGVKTIFLGVLSVVCTITVLFAAYHGLNGYIDERIETRITDPTFLKKLGRSVRPSLVFDEQGSIVADMGAVSLVDRISVTKDSKNSLKIIVSPFAYFGIEPVLEALDDEYRIHAEQGLKFDWIFHLYEIPIVTMERGALERDRKRFRLEFIR